MIFHQNVVQENKNPSSFFFFFFSNNYCDLLLEYNIICVVNPETHTTENNGYIEMIRMADKQKRFAECSTENELLSSKKKKT